MRHLGLLLFQSASGCRERSTHRAQLEFLRRSEGHSVLDFRQRHHQVRLHAVRHLHCNQKHTKHISQSALTLDSVFLLRDLVCRGDAHKAGHTLDDKLEDTADGRYSSRFPIVPGFRETSQFATRRSGIRSRTGC